MNRRLVMNLLIIGLIAMIMFYAAKQGGDSAPEYSNDPTLMTDLQAEQVDSIRIVRDGKKHVELIKQDGVWWLIYPYMAHADHARVQRVLDLLARKSTSYYAAKDVNLESAFLLPPGLLLTFNQTENFGFGTTDPLRGLRYIMHNDRVFLVEDLFLHILAGEYTQFVNRLVIPESVFLEEIATPNYTLYFEDNQWKSRPQLDDSTLNKLYNDWRNAFSQYVGPYQARPDAKHFSLTAPNPRVTIALEAAVDGSTLYIGRPDIGVEYRLPKRMAADLQLF